MAVPPTGTVTMLFTDIEGSTRLLDRLGPDQYRAALELHREVLREAFERHGGYEVDREGDAFFHRLDQRLPHLIGGARDVDARQQTVRATLDWSYDLLSPAEQVLFARLGVFVGGFRLEAAEAVCDPDRFVPVRHCESESPARARKISDKPRRFFMASFHGRSTRGPERRDFRARLTPGTPVDSERVSAHDRVRW